MKLFLLILGALARACAGGELDFPPGFRFGAASSAYQVEGAWNASDKSPSIWDTFTKKQPSSIVDNGTGEEACNSYHLWERDIEIAKELGLDFYRFSISWTRLLPSGFPNHISEDGKSYYNNLIDGLLEAGIEPVVTIFHWDLPQRLQDLGGWANPLLADWFTDYARVVFSLYSPRVKTWLTINEPSIHCSMGYADDVLAPGLDDPLIASYLCNKHMLVAHAKAWRMYDEEFRESAPGGRVSLALHSSWYEPVSEDDEEITNLVNHYAISRFSHPVFSKQGGWPPLVVDHMARLSREGGYPRSRLPEFTEAEIELVRGTFDFYAFNHYTSRTIRRRQPGEEVGRFPLNGGPDLPAIIEVHEDWPQSAMPLFPVYAEGIRKSLSWLKQQYGDVEFIITENGLSNYGGRLDCDRRDYFRDYLRQILLAINEDGVNVTGYTAWTLIDNFEWFLGYTPKFGLYAVDFSSPLRPRTPRLSARFYRDVIRRRSLDVAKTDER